MYSEGGNDDQCVECIEDICIKAGQTWLETNSTLLQHVFDFNTKLADFLMEAKALLQAQQDHIWTDVHQASQDAGVPMSYSLVVALHLLKLLPTLPANLTFHSAVPLLTSFEPEVYASWPWLGLNSFDLMHTPPPHSKCMAMDKLRDEIICQAAGRMMATSGQLPMSTISVPPNHADSDRQEAQLSPIAFTQLSFT